jgi:double-stranded uracil-DNA glycosylase
VAWSADRVLVAASSHHHTRWVFTRAELEAYRDHTVDDLIPDHLKLLFVGINPGLWTAATNTHFAHPGNRFYPALRLAGIISAEIPSTGMNHEHRSHLISRGIGLTNLVARATARADELSKAELQRGGEQLLEFVARYQPRVVAIAGITAYRQAFGQPKAVAGEQPLTLVDEWSGAQLFVVPNPSGLNAHSTVESLATAYREAAVAAGVALPQEQANQRPTRGGSS